ncbi:TPA: N-acetylglucosamine-specific PTS transporter subunit IIBC [Bacillus wiedmannii]|uniref:N-acetylglucosamine-specific PTS transporter subunit IIBC n=1 Tax=Bacillus cereus group TaxID=86661 RepID=UPI000955CB1F|nr:MULTISPECIES: N-acetylglucosamine-specific PTS transporter subunit IIBC [Bacillus cereus group]MBJ8084577.1 PTS transporter subunit EIIC [Bacillus cereus group sp. N14]MDI6678533.1 N-acetylglucosamine-specific PTS transporter subunit IIBC [Bacillus wiedmannii]RKF51303.1 PTS N-acetylglucosamine transporter subunit IIB [Bacillus wiedmannii]SIR85261.1 PTS system N-acetylglucosamine-specific IIB component, Glc family /PTS system N-acetylglucosamine-specific IIC component, Glc family [Bacillus ce
MLQFLQRIGKALMLPIAVLPAAGLLLRLGQPDVFDIPVMAQAGAAVFDNLALIFAIGIAIGLSVDGSGAAGLAGAIGYLVMKNSIDALSKGYSTVELQDKLGKVQDLIGNSANVDPSKLADTMTQVSKAAELSTKVDMKVLGGIIVGVIAGFLYNKFHKIKLPEWLGFFAGKRFVPIVTSVVMLILGILFAQIWPAIQNGIDALAHGIVNLGAVGSGLFGLLNRLLIPIGLHHVMNTYFWFVFGDFTNAAGNVVNGDIARFLAGDKTAGMFMTGFFPVMMFGLPAACFAMIAAAKPEKRKMVTGMLGGLALTSFLTGITEPIEFSFMFLSPVLYGIHAVLTGISLFVTTSLGIHDGFTFSAGAIDYFLNFGIATKPVLLAGIGLIYAVIYFVVFYFLIKKFDLKTPGREDDDELAEEDDAPVAGSIGETYVAALGGKENLTVIDNCATRLRLQVKDAGQVNEAALKRAGAKGVMKLSNTSVQVIVGTNVESVADDMKKHV